MNLALFGDLHGRVLLAFWLCKRWEQEHGERLDYALCTGDVGVFRSLAQMDKASQRFAAKYPEELGFSKFFYNFSPASHKIEPHPAATALLDSTGASLYFVPGNHEDHDYFWRVEHEYAFSADQPVAVDYDWEGVRKGRYANDEFSGYGRVRVLPQGPLISLPGPLNEETWEPTFNLTLRAVNGLDAYTMPEAFRGECGGSLDIVLSHEAPHGRLRGCTRDGRLDGCGSERLADFLDVSAPKHHFFGHYHIYCPEAELPCLGGPPVRSVGLNQIIFRDDQPAVSRAGFGVLRVSAPGSMEFQIVSDDWFQALRRQDVGEFL